MSLRSKIVAILLAVVALYGLTDFLVQRMAIAPSFGEIERDEATADYHRVREAILWEQQDLEAECIHLATWSETVAYARRENPYYPESNLGDGVYDRLGVDLLYITDVDGNILWGGTRDPSWKAGIDLPRILSDAVVLTRAIRQAAEDQNGENDPDYVPRVGHSGIRSTDLAPLLLATRPIGDPERPLEIEGAVIVGRMMDFELVRELRERTAVQFDLWPFDDPAMPTESRALLNEVTGHYEPWIVDEEPNLAVYQSWNDMASAPAFLLRVEVPRSISHAGRTALRFAWNSTVVAGLLMLLVLIWVLEKTVLRPLSMLTRHVEAIGRTEDVHARLNLDRDDELGVLSREFDDMMTQLARSRMDLVEAAREAGMSEIATGILHNVGNTLNSVNVSASLLANKVRNLSSAKDLAAVIGVLDQHSDDLSEFIATDQGKHLHPFLSSISTSLESGVGEIADEVGSLIGGIEHIRELIQSQQSYAGRSSLVVSLLPEELLEEAFMISERAMTHDPTMEIVREFEPMPRLMLDRHKILEILVNLMQNARQAMNSIDVPRRQLTMRAIKEEVGASPRLVLEVSDTGAGIDRETIEKIFNMGFTTKSDGHGFGLHAAANSATEMDGQLTARSAGLGQGATFRLELPYVEAPVAANPQ